MGTLKELRAKYNAENLLRVFNDSIAETKGIAVELVRSQLKHGKKGDGPMPKYKSKTYAEYKQALGSEAPFGIVDLKLTGAFYEKLFLRRTQRGFAIRSSDTKNSKLQGIYGSEIFELNDENLDTYINQYLIPTILSKLK